MNIEIDIDEYVSEEEKKKLCIEYIQEMLRGDGDSAHKERVLNNIAYHAAFELFDDTLSKEDLKTIRTKTKRIIQDKSNYGIFRKEDAWGSNPSAAWLEVEKAIETHKPLITDLVKEAIVSRDYHKDITNYEDCIMESIITIFERGLEK